MPHGHWLSGPQVTAGIKQTQVSWPRPHDRQTNHSTQHPVQLTLTSGAIHHYRDGDVVLYRRPRSRVWQCRYRLLAGQWIRVSTRQRNLEDAARKACDLYDEARFRERLGLAPVSCLFRTVAEETINQLTSAVNAGTGKKIFRDYRTAIERYFIPFFGSRHIERIDHRAVSDFEQWRNQQMGRGPAHSTLLAHAAVWQRIHQTALERGWITERQPWPRLGVQGRRAQARPGFTAEETEQLRAFMVSWSTAP